MRLPRSAAYIPRSGGLGAFYSPKMSQAASLETLASQVRLLAIIASVQRTVLGAAGRVGYEPAGSPREAASAPG